MAADSNGMSPVPARRIPGWTALPLLFVVAAGAWAALPGGLSRGLGMVLVSALVVVALALAVREARPTTRRSWQALLVGQVLCALGWASWTALPVLSGRPLGTPNAGDALFLAGYAAYVVGLTGLARRAGAGRGALHDAAILLVSGGVLIWATIGSPQANASGVGMGARVVGVAYPMIDVLLVAAALGIAVARNRSPRALLLLGWAVLQLTGDLLYGWQVAAGSFAADSISHAVYVAAFALLAGAAVHPSSDHAWHGPALWRPVVLVVAVLPLPGLLAVRVVQGSSQHVPLVAVASLVVTLLAVLRAAQSGAALPVAAEHALRRALLRWSAVLVLGALLPLVGLAAVAVTQARATFEAELVDRLRATASSSAAHADGQLRVLQDLVSSYADRGRLVRATRQAVEGPVAADRQQGADLLQVHLAELAGRSPHYVGAWVLDARGTLLAFSHDAQDAVGRNFAHRDYARGVFGRGAPYASDAFVSDLPGRPHLIALASPVRDRGQVIGAVVLGHRLEALDRSLDASGRQSRAEVNLTDRRGAALGGPGAGGEGLRSLRHVPGVGEALRGRSGVLQGAEDEGSWSAYTALPSTGYAVIARVSADEATRPAQVFTGRVVAAATLLGQLLLAGLLLQVAAERRRRAALALLATREEQVREVLQAAGDAFVSLDDAGVVLAWNRRAEELYGWSAAEAVGSPLVDLVVDPDDREAFAADMVRPPGPGADGPVLMEVTQRRRDGSPFTAELTSWSTSTGGRTVHNAFVRDATGRKEHEATLARARDEALRASRMKSEFVANMSHEIRTPLNGVVGMTTLLRDTPLDARQRDFVDTLAGSADALLRVLNDVLDFSKIEAGKLDVEPGDVDLGSLAAEVVELFSAAAGVKELALDVVVDPALPPVLRTDGHRLRQVLTNLVSNAVKFTACGSVVLEVAATGSERDDGVPVRFSVRDTGPGIRVEDQEHLFEAFTQADASITRRHGGTGLGLAISRRLVELLGGDLTVRSSPGEGSTFDVRLVLPRGQETATTEPAEPVVPPVPAGPRGRLLVAEDSPVNQLVVVELLRMAGFEADVAGDGAQAVTMLEEGEYDLVLMDCQMPVLDGFGATALIRALPSPRCEVPVVALTASVLVEDRDQCLAAGMDDFLAKPLRVDELEEVLGRVLARHRSAAAART